MTIRDATLAGLILLTAACAGGGGAALRHEPGGDGFFATARLIMSREEAEIYRHLPDEAARQEFIAEFWDKRNPDPGNGQNQARAEFERRIAYANRWFRENRSVGRGWDTDRGRILLQLGEPDKRELNEALGRSGNLAVERWYYYADDLFLEFVDRNGYGEFRLDNFPPHLLTVLAEARSALDLGDRTRPRRVLRFDVACRDGRLILSLPLKSVSFQEANGELSADFTVTCTIYRNFRRTARLSFEPRLRQGRDELLKRKSVTLELPLPLSEKGRYYLDVVLQERSTQARFRNFCRFSR